MMKLRKILLVIICVVTLGFMRTVDAEVAGQADFEDPEWQNLVANKPGNLQIFNNGWSATGGALLNSDPRFAHSGSRSLMFNHGSDESGGSVAINAPRSNAVYVRFYIMYGPTFDFPYGIKMLQLSEGDWTAPAQERFILVLNTWGPPLDQTPGQIDDSVSVGFYTQYEAENGFRQFHAKNSKLERNRWYCIETQVILNTPGASNGTVRLWIDGSLSELNNVMVRGSSTRPIGLDWIGGPYSNSNGGQNPIPNPEQPSVRYFDDLVVTTGERVGCPPSTADKTPPAPPQGVRLQ